MIIIKEKTRQWIQFGATIALGSLVATASAAPSAVHPLPPLENTTLQVLEQESHGPQKISNDEFENAQAMSATHNNIQGSLDSSIDADMYRIDVPLGQTLSVALANSTGAHEFKVYQYIVSDAGIMFFGRLMALAERDEQWIYKEIDSAHTGSVLQVSPGAFTLKRGVDEYAAPYRTYTSDYMDRLTPHFFVKVQNKAGAIKPAGGYVLQVSSAAPQVP
jgi:hypothetical protein